MLDELKSAEVVNKVGGRFKLAALVQKRMAELLQGSRPLIDDSSGLTLLEIVAQEILQDKITIEGTSGMGKGGEADLWRLKL
ncbi:MAG: DNA-directed RNA polymerase subunit omega [Sedimentisphaerales bacterium]|jgi:DNA-directed RNA polymerase subunit omega|nr:DNA-directed RNA polymerase subunit omega [Sedimentisphaerales bacterium]